MKMGSEHLLACRNVASCHLQFELPGLCAIMVTTRTEAPEGIIALKCYGRLVDRA